MPPQPIRSVRRNATVQLDPFALRRHPDLAARVAEIIAVWSRVDSELGGILAYMLKGGARPSIAMYSALTSSAAQMAALEAAARVSLSPDDLGLFRAILVLVKRAGAKRNKIAHWLWGDSPEIPEALLLVDPEAVLLQHVNTKEFAQAIEK